MKKKDFVTLIMSTIGGILFALGMCMGLAPEWAAMQQGVVIGVIGAAILGVGTSMSIIWGMMVPGIINGIFGMGGMGFAWPRYNLIINKDMVFVKVY